MLKRNTNKRIDLLSAISILGIIVVVIIIPVLYGGVVQV